MAVLKRRKSRRGRTETERKCKFTLDLRRDSREVQDSARGNDEFSLALERKATETPLQKRDRICAIVLSIVSGKKEKVFLIVREVSAEEPLHHQSPRAEVTTVARVKFQRITSIAEQDTRSREKRLLKNTNK